MVLRASNPQVRADIAITLGLATLGVGARAAAAWWTGGAFISGIDLEIWSPMAVRDPGAMVGLAPPLWPIVAGALGAWFGTAEVGRALSVLGTGLVGATVFAGARAAGADRWVALGGAIVAWSLPDLFLAGQCFHPDGTAWWLLTLGAALAAANAVTRRGALLAPLLLAAVALVFRRESGPLLAATAAFALVTAPPVAWSGRPGLRWALPLLLAGGLLATPRLVPTQGPHNHAAEEGPSRLGMPVEDFRTVVAGGQVGAMTGNEESWPLGDRAAEIEARKAFARVRSTPRAERPLLVARIHARRAWLLGWDLLLWHAAGAIGVLAFAAAAPRRGEAVARLAPLVPLGAIVTALVFWSARRHLAALAPIGVLGATLGLGVWAARAGPRLRALLGGTTLTAGIVYAAMEGIPRGVSAAHAQTARFDQVSVYARLGKELRTRARPGDRLDQPKVGNQDTRVGALYAELPDGRSDRVEPGVCVWRLGPDAQGEVVLVPGRHCAGR